MGQRGRPRSPGLLTPREQEVFDLIRAGRSNAEIGEALGISVETVKQHVSQVLAKLGVTTREEAAAWQPERAVRRSIWRLLGAAAGLAIVASAIAGLGMLAWGLSESGETDHRTSVAVTSTASPVAPVLGSAPSIVQLLAGPTMTQKPVLPTGPPATFADAFSVYVSDASGGNPTRVADGVLPVWSRDGLSLAFLQDAGGNAAGGCFQVTVRGPDSAIHPVGYSCSTDIAGCSGEPIGWSWNNALVDFCALVPSGFGDHTQAIAARPDGTGSVEITSNGNVAWSPTDWRMLVSSPASIVVYDAMSGKPLSSLGPGASPVWSPDGKMVAFVTSDSRGVVHNLNVSDARNGALIMSATLPDDPVAAVTTAWKISWAGDSGKLAIGTGSMIVVADVSTGQLKPVATGEYPCWSPADDVIAFSTTKGAGDNSRHNIFTVAAEGGPPTFITEGMWPAWSPDGTEIAFSR